MGRFKNWKLEFLLCMIQVIFVTQTQGMRSPDVIHMTAPNSRIDPSILKNVLMKSSQYGLDPDARKDMSQLIRGEGYPSENYTVQTVDGYLLEIFRIPAGRHGDKGNGTKPVAFLQHGLISSSADWVMNFQNGSLGFILADAGYDVWMGNSRGNTYSRRHVSLSPKDDKFWDFSFQEMGEFDIPAVLSFVLKKTKQDSLFYVGHSQGTTQMFALLAKSQEWQKKIKLFVPLAPVARLTNAKSPLLWFASLPDNVIFDILGRKQVMTSGPLMKALADTVCDVNLSRPICESIVFLLCGPDIKHLNQTRLVVYLNHTPAGASSKCLAHYAQVTRYQRFQMWDYGSSDENVKHYNQTHPPVYNVSDINTPIAAYTGSNDWLSDPEDNMWLMSALPNLKQWVSIEGWNHLDLVWGTNAAQLVYYDIVKVFGKYK